jgi:hypothetical protein
MSEPTSRRIRRQRLGLRPGTEPYYQIAEQTDTRLVLQSRPGANRRAGYRFMARGVALLLLGLLFFCLTYTTLGQQAEGAFLSVAFGTVVLGVLGWFGLSGLVGGLAVATTTNTITLDTADQSLVYAQRSRVLRQVRERTQTLHREQVARLRLRPRAFKPPGLLQRVQSIMALEFVTDEGHVWLIDSADDPLALQPTATTFAQMLGMELEIVDREHPAEQPATGADHA